MPRIIEAFNAGTNVLQTPFRLIVAGPSGAGKTELVKQIVDNEFYSSSIDNIVYCYPGYLDEVPTEFETTVNYHPGLPKKEYLSGLPKGTLLIFDDMMVECCDNEDVGILFTVIARKRNISVILMSQNIYQQGKIFRTLRLNATHLALFKFRAANDVNLRMIRDLGLTNHISRELLEKATSERYTYIMIDVHPNRQYDFGCIRGNIFLKNFPVYYTMEYVAIPKSEFIKYFKIIEAKKGKIKAIKNEIEIKKDPEQSSSDSKRERKRPRQYTESTSESESD